MISLDKLVTRESLPIFAKESGWSNGVEVGTYRGEFAAHILTHWGGHLTTIDPFIDQPTENYLDGCVDGVAMADIKREAYTRLEGWLIHHRCRILEEMSSESAVRFYDGSVDFVYIDSNHNNAAEDIALWWPKLRSGGLLGLHDTYDRHDEYQRCSVWTAVFDFANTTGIKPHLTPCTSSWFLKP